MFFCYSIVPLSSSAQIRSLINEQSVSVGTVASFFGHGHDRGCHISWQPVLETCRGLKVYRRRRAARRIGAYAPRTMHIHEAPCIFTSGCSPGSMAQLYNAFGLGQVRTKEAVPSSIRRRSICIAFLDRTGYRGRSFRCSLQISDSLYGGMCGEEKRSHRCLTLFTIDFDPLRCGEFSLIPISEAFLRKFCSAYSYIRSWYELPYMYIKRLAILHEYIQTI